MKNFRKAAFSTICMLIVAVMSLTGATYAWFTAGTTATVNGMQMQVSAAEGGVQVSAMKNGNWTTYAATVALGSTLTSVKPVSSTDGQNFFQLDVNTANSQEAYTVEAATGNVMTHRLKLKNPGATDIKVVLSPNSQIVDATGTGLTATEIENAARVAIYEATEDGSAKQGGFCYIWAPNDEKYNGIIAAKNDAYLSLSNGFLPQVTDVCVEKLITAGNACEVALPKITENGTETEVFVNIAVWIEGQDADCVNMNAGGSFDVQLQFVVK